MMNVSELLGKLRSRRDEPLAHESWRFCRDVSVGTRYFSGSCSTRVRVQDDEQIAVNVQVSVFYGNDAKTK